MIPLGLSPLECKRAQKGMSQHTHLHKDSRRTQIHRLHLMLKYGIMPHSRTKKRGGRRCKCVCVCALHRCRHTELVNTAGTILTHAGRTGPTQSLPVGLRELVQADSKHWHVQRRNAPLILISALHMDQPHAAYDVGVDERHHRMSSREATNATVSGSRGRKKKYK